MNLDRKSTDATSVGSLMLTPILILILALVLILILIPIPILM